ncbi:MAG: OmpA family protein [Candidatus Kappaea frigidicola]|nr:OmpA family protein [Candidatus Kappaea frigidicola]
MEKSMKKFSFYFLAAVMMMVLAGCAIGVHKRSPQDVQTIKSLSQQLEDLRRAKSRLESQLQKEIAQGDVSITMGKRGLVVTVVAEVLFDSGKAKIKPQGQTVLNKVANVLGPMSDDIAIEGHTDNVPIKFSRWKSNWELSTQRALNVVHYFEDDKGIRPQRMSATGYGPYHPVTSNDTPEGKLMNRRVEIIVLRSSRSNASNASADDYDEFIK